MKGCSSLCGGRGKGLGLGQTCPAATKHDTTHGDETHNTMIDARPLQNRLKVAVHSLIHFGPGRLSWEERHFGTLCRRLSLCHRQTGHCHGPNVSTRVFQTSESWAATETAQLHGGDGTHSADPDANTDRTSRTHTHSHSGVRCLEANLCPECFRQVVGHGRLSCRCQGALTSVATV